MVQCPMIVVTDPDELILMKAKDVSFDFLNLIQMKISWNDFVIYFWLRY